MERLHEILIRECYELARRAVARGNHPFGALLATGGRVVFTAENTVVVDRDVTRHAELNLVSRALRELGPAAVRGCTLYTSTEPCVMCAGAIYWAQIPVVVYGCSAAALRSIAGESLLVPCTEVFGRGSRPTRVLGPVLEAEGLQIHKDFWKR